MNQIPIQIKLKKILLYMLYAIFVLILSACKKGYGAICRDGSRSHSTGRGTCSWHGGVDYYLDPNEIDIGSTIGLVVFLIIVISVIVKFKK